MKNWENNIETNPDILYGKPVIKGTRIPVDLLLEKMSNGQSFQEILQGYPDLNEVDLYACLAYATSLIRNEISLPLAS
ncbi:MAG: DUF433 domain-containing protein [Bacteroidetes bacterium]|nr:DUF433 domain-containing protein [Bacteroidota bacterium]